jgi:hypothetical protein
MTMMKNLVLRTFGRPKGILGKLGGIVMARANADFGGWVVGLLKGPAAHS